LLEIISPLAEHITQSSLTNKTVDKHLDNLWLLGGEIIRRVSRNKDYSTPAITNLKIAIGSDGGLYCRHLITLGLIPRSLLRHFGNATLSG